MLKSRLKYTEAKCQGYSSSIQYHATFSLSPA